MKGIHAMKKMQCLLIGIGAVLALVMTILLGNPGIVLSEQKECHIVTIRSQEGISRETLKIKKDDCVVWINRTYPGEDVKVIFKEGKKCADMTKSPTGFKPDWAGCYVTDFLDSGQTSSLLFIQAGTFIYEVEFRETSSPLGRGATQVGRARFGKIIVE